MTRSVVERVEEIPGATLPGGLVDLMRAENAARRHALAEGHPDPYPLPLGDACPSRRRRSRPSGGGGGGRVTDRAHGHAGARESLPEHPPGEAINGCNSRRSPAISHPPNSINGGESGGAA